MCRVKPSRLVTVIVLGSSVPKSWKRTLFLVPSTPSFVFVQRQIIWLIFFLSQSWIIFGYLSWPFVSRQGKCWWVYLKYFGKRVKFTAYAVARLGRELQWISTPRTLSCFVIFRGFTGTKPKEHSLNEQLHGDVFELEKTIRKYQNIQKDADEYALKDATEWDAAMRRFDDSSTKIQKQLSETFSVIETLRKNAARLRSHNLLSSRLVTNPAAYYSISASVES